MIAHELGHHVQSLMGTDAQVAQAQSARPDQQNLSQSTLELQADCYCRSLQGQRRQGRRNRRVTLETGDVEAWPGGRRAAIGDDRILNACRRARLRPTGAHPRIKQRVTWFRRGLETGDPNACNTFK